MFIEIGQAFVEMLIFLLANSQPDDLCTFKKNHQIRGGADFGIHYRRRMRIAKCLFDLAVVRVELLEFDRCDYGRDELKL